MACFDYSSFPKPYDWLLRHKMPKKLPSGIFRDNHPNLLILIDLLAMTSLMGG